MAERYGEYEKRGDYHKHLDPNWGYYPIYIRKVSFVDDYIKSHIAKTDKLLDAGCGEGVIVEKYKEQGYDITGIDIDYSSDDVIRGDILNMPFKDAEFDLVLLLDVIEHLQFQHQEKVLHEIRRVLKNDGTLIMSIPNLAHKASRWKFFFKGQLIRTANILKHPGDRPIKEYLQVLHNCEFRTEKRFPIKLTLPPLMEKMYKYLLRGGYEEYIFSPKRKADDCFLNIFVLKKHNY